MPQRKKASKPSAKARGGAALPPRQAAFVAEYLKDLNATQAAIRAGYSAHTAEQQGPRLLGNVGVRAALDVALEGRSARLQLDADWVLTRLKEISDRCMTVEPVCDRRGNVIEGEFQFDSMGANKATELIGKHLGLFIDRQRIEGGPSVNVRIVRDGNGSAASR